MREGSNCKIRSPDKFVELVMGVAGGWVRGALQGGMRGDIYYVSDRGLDLRSGAKIAWLGSAATTVEQCLSSPSS